jgi:hypothetical protein
MARPSSPRSAALRQTLFQFDEVESVEIRLQGDCGAFFEWIQAAPQCHLLTRDGMVAAPSRPD